MTIQTLFNRMMVLDNQLDLISGGDDVTRGLVILNLIQDWIELEASLKTGALQTTETFTTTASQEHTTWPERLMRIDGLWLLDSNGKPVREIEDIDKTGGHAANMSSMLASMALTGSMSTGAPQEFQGQGQGGNIYWHPTPDAVYTIRAYGLWAVADYTLAGNTFGRPDSVALAVVPHATKMFRMGLDRDLVAIQTEVTAAAKKVMQALGGQVRVGASSRDYGDIHDT